MLMLLASNQTPSLVTAANITTYLNNTAMTRTAGGTDGGETADESLSESAKERSPVTAENVYFSTATVKTYFREKKRLDFSFSCRHQK
jgi:hypothetical protein